MRAQLKQQFSNFTRYVLQFFFTAGCNSQGTEIEMNFERDCSTMREEGGRAAAEHTLQP